MPTPKISEFKHDESRICVVFVEPFAPSFKKAIERIAKDPSLQWVVCSSSIEAATLARKVAPCLIVAHAAKETDSLRHVSMQQLLKPLINRKMVRILMTSSIRDANSNARLEMELNAELLNEPVSEKSLNFKIDRLIKILPKPVSKKSQSQPDAIVKAPTLVERPVLQSPIRWTEPLTLESDCWAVAKESIRQSAGRWQFKLRGPGVEYGSWKTIESGVKGLEAWKWTPVDPEEDPFIHEQGGWVFLGQKPDFHEGYWNFASTRPHLGFYYQNECYGAKVNFDPEGVGILWVAQDSLIALRLLLPQPAKKADASPPRNESTEVAYIDPLILESDFWLLQGRKPRRVASKWVISLLGPSPEIGNWVRIQSAGGAQAKSDADEGYWQWKPNDPEHDPFLLEEGAWVFYGAMPKYTENLWVFFGKKPLLAFFYEKENYGSKIAPSAEGGLMIARDSVAALQFLPLIEARIEKIVSEKKDRKEGPTLPIQENVYPIPTGQLSVPAGQSPPEQSPLETLDTLNTEIAIIEKQNEVNPLLVAAVSEPEVREKAPPGEISADLQAPPAILQEELPSGPPGSENNPCLRRAEDGRTVYLFEFSVFGSLGGEWENVATGTEGRRWYLFLPIELLNHSITDFRHLGRYWIFFGSPKPEKVEDGGVKYWSFTERKPQGVSRFGDLTPEAQKFLTEYFSKPKEKATEEAPPPEPPSDFVDPAPSSEHADSEYLNEAVQPEKAPDYLDEKPVKSRFRGTVTLSLDKKNQDLELKEARTDSVEKNYLDSPEIDRRLSSQERGPSLLPEVAPPGPSLSVLAVAFLMSELICKPDLDRKLIGVRFCQYLSASFGGLRVELWVNAGESWFCAGASEHRQPVTLELASFGSLFEEGASALVHGPLQLEAHGNVYTIPVRLKVGKAERLLGALCVGGERVAEISSEYAAAMGQISRGLLITLSGEAH